jgi:hypothetical protein
MIGQMTLFPPKPVPISARRDLTPEERFHLFHSLNPHVYEACRTLALDLRRRVGLRKASMRLIFNQLRWLYVIQTQGDTYRINDHYSPYYARMLMDEVPELKDFFETRRANADDQAGGTT